VVSTDYLTTLKRLGFSRSTISEVLLSLSLGSEVNVAPMGARLGRGPELVVKVFTGCRTYEMVRHGARDYVINVTSDPTLFYYAVLGKGSLRLVPSRTVSAPRVVGCVAYVEAVRKSVEYRRGYLVLSLAPTYVEVSKQYPKAFNRATPAIIEALVYLTKIPYLVGRGRLGEARELLRNIRTCAEVVTRVTSNRRLRAVAYDIVRKAEEFLGST